METLSEFLKFTSSKVDAKSPHVFMTASTAYQGLCSSELCQTILISGESGAGKTESTKFVMKLLALAGSKDWTNRSQIEEQVLQSNPLLEAFGNARTLRNDNSSRFGKFIEMQFELTKSDEPSTGASLAGTDTKVGRLAGARIHTYLLETVRICHQLEGERNYHMLYQLCAAAAAGTDEAGIYKFPQRIKEGTPCEFDMSKYASFDNFRYLTKSSCSTLQRVDDVEEFENTILAMQTIGIPFADQSAMLKVVAAVLYVGNVDFESAQGGDTSSVSAGSTLSLRLACHLLGIKESVLRDALCYRTIRTRAETYKKPLRINEAEDIRDALARALYGTLFLKIVESTNSSIGYRESVKLFCGVLDIFGFECFDTNSFEQLCINFTNERLQQFFNTFIFKCEEELYDQERIPWDPLDFPDNQDCVDMLQLKPSGLFSMLDEECIVPQGSDRGFVNKLKDRFKDHVRFGLLRTRPVWFAVNHFAGPVNYCSDGFLEKNRDQLSADAQEAIYGCSNTFAKQLFTKFLNRGGNDDTGKV
eukprot:Lankesteria_metandrocarpae@DN704_c0_g1_i1.p1